MNYLLIDVSYFNFWRFYATKQWYMRAHQDEQIEDGYDWSENVIFMEKFNKLYFSTFDKYKKKFKPDKIILARDCSRKDIWRMKFFKEYKMNREEAYSKNKFMGGKVFKWAYENILPKLLENPLYTQIKLDNLEADDIIYLSCKQIRKNEDNKITIISSDHDLLQIIDKNFNIKLYTGNLKSYNNKCKGNKDICNFLKAILGDGSDNIPKVFKGVGEKTAIKLYNSNKLLLEKFKQNPSSFERYALNRLLVDFAYIPKHLEDNFPKDIFL